MADAKKRKPWMKFYPADWQADDGLRQCSLAARGLWIEMIAIMHKAEPCGHLLIAGVNPTVNQLAAAVRADGRTVKAALDELERWNVFNISPTSTIYSRRMIADAEKEARDAANGKNGGNPILKASAKGKEDNGEVNGGVNPPDKAQKPEARSQSPDKKESSLRSDSARESFDQFWRVYPRKVGRGQAVKAYERALTKIDPDALLAAVQRYPWSPDPQFVPHASTWLNGERWADEAPVPGRPGAGPPISGRAAAARALAEDQAEIERRLRGFDGDQHDFFGGITIDGETT